MLKFFCKISILIIFLFSVLSCQEQQKNSRKIEGFEQTETGLYYKFHKREEGEKVGKGDLLIGEIKEYMDEEKIYDNSLYIGVFGREDDPPKFKGDITEGFRMLRVGDSVSFLVNLDSLKKFNPDAFKNCNGNFLIVSIRLDSIINRHLYDSLYAYLDAINEAMYEEDMLAAKTAIETGKMEEVEEINRYIRSHNIQEKPNSQGVYIIKKENGSGKRIKKGDVITINYIARLLTGEIFDTSIESVAEEANIIFPQRIFEPVQFRVGHQETIEGIDHGITNQRVGSKLIFIIPSEYAFGYDGNADVAEFTPVIFEIEILKNK